MLRMVVMVVMMMMMQGWTSSLIWNAFSNLTIPQAAGEGRDNPAETVPSASTGAVSGTSRVAKVAGPFRDRPGAAPQQVHPELAPHEGGGAEGGIACRGEVQFQPGEPGICFQGELQRL